MFVGAVGIIGYLKLILDNILFASKFSTYPTRAPNITVVTLSGTIVVRDTSRLVHSLVSFKGFHLTSKDGSCLFFFTFPPFHPLCAGTSITTPTIARLKCIYFP